MFANNASAWEVEAPTILLSFEDVVFERVRQSYFWLRWEGRILNRLWEVAFLLLP